MLVLTVVASLWLVVFRLNSLLALSLVVPLLYAGFICWLGKPQWLLGMPAISLLGICGLDLAWQPFHVGIHVVVVTGLASVMAIGERSIRRASDCENDGSSKGEVLSNIMIDAWAAGGIVGFTCGLVWVSKPLFFLPWNAISNPALILAITLSWLLIWIIGKIIGCLVGILLSLFFNILVTADSGLKTK